MFKIKIPLFKFHFYSWIPRLRQKRIKTTGANGFPSLKEMPEALKRKCKDQNWDGIEVRYGLAEGRGVFTTKTFEAKEVVCNYGGTNVPRDVAETYLLPFEDKCNYVVELFEQSHIGWQKFYLNCKAKLTFGQTLNHSSLHPNVKPDVYSVGPQQLDLLFKTVRSIDANEQLVWNYGNNYSGVKPCVQNCERCKL